MEGVAQPVHTAVMRYFITAMLALGGEAQARYADLIPVERAGDGPSMLFVQLCAWALLGWCAWAAGRERKWGETLAYVGAGVCFWVSPEVMIGVSAVALALIILSMSRR